MKAYFTWYERIYFWFKGLFRKKQVIPEGEQGNIWAEHIKFHSDELIKKINEDLLKPYNVKIKVRSTK